MYLDFEIKVVRENGNYVVYMGHDGSSGVKYELKTTEEVAEKVSSYVKEECEVENGSI